MWVYSGEILGGRGYCKKKSSKKRVELIKQSLFSYFYFPTEQKKLFPCKNEFM